MRTVTPAVAAGQHVATITYRGGAGTPPYTHDIEVDRAPTSAAGFTSIGSYDEAVSEARSQAEQGAIGIFRMPEGDIGTAALRYATTISDVDPPLGISGGEDAQLAVKNLGWAPDLTATGAHRSTEALLAIVDAERVLDLRTSTPIAPPSDDDSGLL